MDTVASISPPPTMLDTPRKIRTRSLQGKDLTPAMQQWVMPLKRPVDEERKHQKAVSTRHPTLCTAQGLDMGEITVKSLLAASRHPEPPLEAHAAKPRGKPASRAAVPLQPVIREDGRATPGAGQRVRVGTLRPYRLETPHAALPPVPLWRTLQRWGGTSGPGPRRSALKAREDVGLARRRSRRQHRANRPPDGSLQRPDVSRDAPCVHKHPSGQFPWSLEADGPGVNTLGSGHL